MSFIVLEVQSLEDVENNVHHLQEFVLELLRSAIEVSIVLRETAHTGQTVKLATLLVAVNGAEFGKAQR